MIAAPPGGAAVGGTPEGAPAERFLWPADPLGSRRAAVEAAAGGRPRRRPRRRRPLARPRRRPARRARRAARRRRPGPAARPHPRVPVQGLRRRPRRRARGAATADAGAAVPRHAARHALPRLGRGARPARAVDRARRRAARRAGRRSRGGRRGAGARRAAGPLPREPVGTTRAASRSRPRSRCRSRAGCSSARSTRCTGGRAASRSSTGRPGPRRRRAADLELKQFQLALYRFAYAEREGIDPAHIDAVFYYVAHDRIVRPERLYSADELRARWATVAGRGTGPVLASIIDR